MAASTPAPAAGQKELTAVVPSLDHFTFRDYQHVYEPADDTYLLLDALLREKELLMELNPSVCIELGPGSGVVSTYLSSLLALPPTPATEDQTSPHAFSVTVPAAEKGAGPAGRLVWAVDINEAAASATAATAAANGAVVEVVRGDKWSALRPSLWGCVDLLVFNPPYVPTPDEEVGGTGVEAAWAGGTAGRVVIDAVLPTLEGLLSPHGVMYMIAVLENKPADIAATLAKAGFVTKIALSRRAFNEVLFVLKVRRADAGAQHEAWEGGMPEPAQ